MVGNREVRADGCVWWAFYAIVDSESAASRSFPSGCPTCARRGWRIKPAIEKAVKVEHPLEPQLHGI